MSKNAPLYLDCNATMPLKPAVVEAMYAVLHVPGNASSVHGFGRRARQHMEDARHAVATLIGTDPAYILFTAGATESNNTVLNSFRGERILMSAIEHPSVRNVAENAGIIPVTAQGIVDLNALESLLQQQKPALVSVMLVNNETGIIQPVADIVRMVRRLSPQTRVHTDAVQALGRIPVDFTALQVDYMSLSAHKMGGPQGAGALVVAPGTKIEKLLKGGGQEKRQRAGTENIAAIAGFGKAAMLAQHDMPAFQALALLRDMLEERLLAIAPQLKIFGRDTPRVANTSQIVLPGIAAETQLMALDLDGIAVSSGSACSSGSVKPNTVLKAMGASDTEALSALRVSLGWQSTAEDIDRFVAAWEAMHKRTRNRIRELSGL